MSALAYGSNTSKINVPFNNQGNLDLKKMEVKLRPQSKTVVRDSNSTYPKVTKIPNAKIPDSDFYPLIYLKGHQGPQEGGYNSLMGLGQIKNSGSKISKTITRSKRMTDNEAFEVQYAGPKPKSVEIGSRPNNLVMSPEDSVQSKSRISGSALDVAFAKSFQRGFQTNNNLNKPVYDAKYITKSKVKNGEKIPASDFVEQQKHAIYGSQGLLDFSIPDPRNHTLRQGTTGVYQFYEY